MNLKPLAFLAAALSIAATPSAYAFFAPTYDVAVTDTITYDNVSLYSYAYKVTNQSTCFGNCGDTLLGKPIDTFVMGLRTYEIPFFTDAGIINIASPMGWSYHILPQDTFNLGFGAGTLQWYALSDDAFIKMNHSLTDFTYQTAFAPGKGPFMTTFGYGDAVVGDPGIPLSPNAILAGIGQAGQVPEPASALLLLAGLGALVARRRAAK